MRDRLRSATPLQVDAALFLTVSVSSFVVLAFRIEAPQHVLIALAVSLGLALYVAGLSRLTRGLRDRREASLRSQSRVKAYRAGMARTVVGSVSFVFFMTLVGLLDGRILTFVLAGLAFAVVLFLGVRLVWKLEEWLHPEWQ